MKAVVLFCPSALHFNLNPGRTISYPNTRLERNPAGTLALIAGGFFAVDKQIDPVAMVFDSDAVLVHGCRAGPCQPVTRRVRNSRGRPQNLLFPVVPPSPGGAGHFVYQLAEAAPKLKNIFDAVIALTR